MSNEDEYLSTVHPERALALDYAKKTELLAWYEKREHLVRNITEAPNDNQLRADALVLREWLFNNRKP